ncbi:glycosyltransferase family A protein [Paraglaciecola sp. Hal342]
MRDKTMQVDSNNTSNPSKAAIARPKVSVIIPVYNDIVRVEACLTSLENQDYPRDRFEVIVVDNGSSDGTYDALQKVALSYAAQQSLIITQCMIPGSYAARNHGLTMATGSMSRLLTLTALFVSNGLMCLLMLFNKRLAM